jgi:uncharacterized membrane protein YoaK (UPF0700 family)
MWFFFSKDWSRHPIIAYKYTWAIAVGFIIFTIFLSWLCVVIKIAWYDLFNFTIPIVVLMMVILVTYPLHGWERALIVIPTIIAITLPMNILVTKITENHMDKENERVNNENKK